MQLTWRNHVLLFSEVTRKTFVLSFLCKPVVWRLDSPIGLYIRCRCRCIFKKIVQFDL